MSILDLFQHLRDAYADGRAGLPFTPPERTPFKAYHAPAEDAYGEWRRGQDDLHNSPEREAQCMHLASMVEYGTLADQRGL